MEVWKDMQGFDGTHQVSNMGNVRSVTRDITNSRGVTRNYIGKIKSQSLGSSGYQQCTISGPTVKTIMVHRYVALAFIENPENKRCVNHKNGNKLDNRLENLEWFTHSENNYHAFQTGLMKPSDKQKAVVTAMNSKTVLDFMSGVYYDSCTHAAKAMGMGYSTLRSMLNGGNPNKTNLRYV